MKRYRKNITTTLLRSLLPLLALAAMGCQSEITALTTPPPGYVGQLDQDDATVRLSAGVALAFRCTDQNGPCDDLSLSVDDAAIASAKPAFSDELAYSSDDRTEIPEATFVLVAHAPGRTVLRVAGSRYDVIVE
jgi:hypothetical protein